MVRGGARKGVPTVGLVGRWPSGEGAGNLPGSRAALVEMIEEGRAPAAVAAVEPVLKVRASTAPPQ